LSYAPICGLSFSPGDPPISSRVAGDGLIAAARKLLAGTTRSAIREFPNGF
jgi:hypothetical protein